MRKSREKVLGTNSACETAQTGSPCSSSMRLGLWFPAELGGEFSTFSTNRFAVVVKLQQADHQIYYCPGMSAAVSEPVEMC